MKVALVHDYLNQYGGGERVLETLMEMFPEAPVYTILYDEKKTGGRFAGRVAGTSFLDFPLARRRHRWFIPFMPLAARSLRASEEYDIVISDSAGFAKGHSLKCRRHIAYIHTPLRYAWEEEYLNGAIGKPQIKIAKPILSYLKKWDYRAGQKPDFLIANSKFIAGKIKKYYGRDAAVVYPPVRSRAFYREPQTGGDYYLAAGRLIHYKRFDLVVDAFAGLGLPLKIAGVGPELQNLKFKIKNLKLENVELLGFCPDGELRTLYNGAKAVIFPQVEDFGLVAAEAQTCGAPVIAYAEGGAKEIVEDGVTGVWFREQTSEALAAAVREFEKTPFDRKKIAKAGERFSEKNFREKFLGLL